MRQVKNAAVAELDRETGTLQQKLTTLKSDLKVIESDKRDLTRRLEERQAVVDETERQREQLAWKLEDYQHLMQVKEDERVRLKAEKRWYE